MQWKTDSPLKFLLKRFLPRPVLSRIKVQFELLRQPDVPRMVKAPAAMRVTVLSPHMDDEVIGCGGTLALSAKQACRVSLVFLTDGRKGYDPARYSDMSNHDLQIREADLVEIRKQEARRAGRILDINDSIFLDFQEGRIADQADHVDRLADALHQTKPQAVFLPFLIDAHPDHWMTNTLFIRAAAKAGLSGGLLCWGYEIWSPLQSNTVVDISDVIETKNLALGEYRSQLADVDYVRIISGLNAYRSVLCMQGQGYAEGFFVAELDVYRGLYEAALSHK